MDLSKITMGVDGIEERIASLEVPVEDMSLPEVRAALQTFDRELSWLEEEDDYNTMHEYGRRSSGREEKAKQARERKLEISQPDGIYEQLVQRFIEFTTSGTSALNPLDARAGDLRLRRNLYDLFLNNEGYKTLQEATKETYSKRRIVVDDLEPLSIGLAVAQLQKEPDPAKREAVYLGLRGLDDVEVPLHRQIQHLTALVAQTPTHPQYSNFFGVSAHYSESPSPEQIAALMQRFIAATKPIYDGLFRELVSDASLFPWDMMFMTVSKDPFTQLAVPQDTHQLFDIGLRLLEDLGYDSGFVRSFYNPDNPGVLLDIEQRENKLPGAATCSLGAFSHGKNFLYYEPTVFSGNARKRWGVFPHEFGHGIHHEFSRRSTEDGAVFFIESTPGNETISMFHEDSAFAPETLRKYLGIAGSDLAHLAKWKLFNDLRQLYGIAAVTLGEFGMHTVGVESARQSFYAASRSVQPDVVQNNLGESPTYVTTPHLFNQPAYYFSYFMAGLNQIALTSAVINQNGTVFSPKTAPFLIDRIMVGNVKPMEERIAEATGVRDPVGNAVDHFRREYAALQKAV